MFRLIPAVLALAVAATPLRADEFTDVVEDALKAYRAGDISVALEELDYATKLLNELKSESLTLYLPEPLPGWIREEADAQGAGMGMAMLGGGTAAAAAYRRGTEELTITLVANSPMVSGIGAMITGMGALTGGRPLRIQRTQFANTDGQLQGVVDNRVMVSVAGNASIEDKTAYLEAMDFRALGEF
jgi:hypothetical protein